jgi:hypothetical protein
MRYALLTLIFVLGSFSSPASAQTAAERAACEADTKKLCPGIRVGGGRIIECLAKQKDKLTDACKKVVESQGK